MKRLYGNIEGWDVDTEYHVLSENVRHFEEEQAKNSGAKYTEMFRGVNACVSIVLCSLMGTERV